MFGMRATRRWATILVVASASLVLVSGCSASSSADSAAGSSEVPDPCELLSAELIIRPILGVDPGQPALTTEDPAVRKLCLFSTGLFLEIEVAENYDRSVAQIRLPEAGATTQDLTGVGQEALLSNYGDGVFQVVARDDRYYVGVTGVITAEQATELASSMLAAIDQG